MRPTVFIVLGLLGIAITTQLSRSGVGSRGPAAQREGALAQSKICKNSELQETYRLLQKRDRWAKKYLEIQRKYVREIEATAHDQHQVRRGSEAVFFVSIAALPVATLFPAGAIWSNQIWGGIASVGLVRTSIDRLFVGERKHLDFEPQDDPLGPAWIREPADVLIRVKARLALISSQHQELSENLQNVLKQFPDGIWGDIRNSVTLGADEDEHIAELLKEATLRKSLYELESQYAQRVMQGLANVCIGDDAELDSRWLALLGQIL